MFFRGRPDRATRSRPRFSEKLKSLCRQTLFSRKEWTSQFLRKVEEGEFDKEEDKEEEGLEEAEEESA